MKLNIAVFFGGESVVDEVHIIQCQQGGSMPWIRELDNVVSETKM